MRKVIASLVGFAALAVAGCNLVQEAESNTVMLGELVSTPDESVVGHSVPGKVVATVFLGTRDRNNLNAQPSPITGAQVHLEVNGASIALSDKGAGLYEVTSSDANNLTYVEGATYRFVAVNGADTFAENVVAPEKEEITEFHQGLAQYDAGFNPTFDDGGALDGFDGGLGALGFVPVTAGQDLVLHRPAADGERPIALTVVTPVTESGPQSPTFVDPTLDAQGLITVLLDSSKYQQDTVTVTGSKAWASCPPSDFLLTVTALKKGTTEGSNLFLGSTALAGSADAAPGHCQ